MISANEVQSLRAAVISLEALPAAHPSTMDDGQWLDDRADASRLIPRLLLCLSERDRDVVIRRHGLFGETPMSLREIGAKIGLAAETVRQIEQRALRKMRAAMVRADQKT